MRLGNTGGRNLGKKYLKIKGNEPITVDNQQRANDFNDWFEKEYFSLKKKIEKQALFCDDEILHETYLRIINKILHGGLNINDYALYFHRSYFTNKIQLAIKENRFVDFDLNRIQQIDESDKNIEIMKKQEETIQDIKAFVLSHYSADHDLFIGNMLEGLTYQQLSSQTGIKEYIIQSKVSKIKKALKEKFGTTSISLKSKKSNKNRQVKVQQQKENSILTSSVIKTEKKLSDFSAIELMKELYNRGYTGILSYTKTVDISKVDIKTV